MSLEYAGFWRRAAAIVIDGLILQALAYGVFIAAFTPFMFAEERVQARVASLVFLGLALLTTAYVLGFWLWRGQTPGKMITRVRVARADGQPLTAGRALRRYFLGYTLSTLTLGSGFLLAAFHPRRRALHDLVAGTCVLRLATSSEESK